MRLWELFGDLEEKNTPANRDSRGRGVEAIVTSRGDAPRITHEAVEAMLAKFKARSARY